MVLGSELPLPVAVGDGSAFLSEQLQELWWDAKWMVVDFCIELVKLRQRLLRL